MLGRCCSWRFAVVSSLSSSARQASSQSRGRTEVILLHFGQPTTEFYAKEYLHKAAAQYYHLPKQLERFIWSRCLVNDKVRAAISEYGKRESVEDTVDRLVANVGESLNTLLPEYGTIRCSSAFLFGEKSIEKAIDGVIERGASRVVFFPLYSHFSYMQTGVILDTVSRLVLSRTVPLIKDGREIQDERVVQGSDVSFRVSAVHRWSSHPTLANFWWKRLEEIVEEVDGVLFTAPALRGPNCGTYRSSVWSTCDGVMARLGDRLPWRLGFHNTWDSWPMFTRDCTVSQMKKMVGKPPHERKVAVVPVTEFLPSFDTFSVLPNLVSTQKSARLVSVESSCSIVDHGLAEVIKNHLLGRRNEQIQLYSDDGCGKARLATSQLFASR